MLSSRGEHMLTAPPSSTSAGSSPLARGTPGRRARAGAPIRFIPARAGNTRGEARAGNTRGEAGEGEASAVHPRSRGEHDSRFALAQMSIGSSPLARGTLRGVAHPARVRRFIPARAGNTLAPLQLRADAPVHPRSRGEHKVGLTTGWRPAGSSPLARGTLRPIRPIAAPTRFIPARAGNTSGAVGASSRYPVHPRSRGEHAQHPRLAHQRRRFIPARAGNTKQHRSPGGHSPVHPRSRGEHVIGVQARTIMGGSSPLARGTRGWRRRGERPARFIPARAGNTRGCGTAARCAAVHPRSRGEHNLRMAPVYTVHGSSPLARGTRLDRGRDLVWPRFIPARAGNTPRMVASTAARPVHPRSRGEHEEDQRDGGQHHRFIPARAGNTRPP